MPVEATTDRRRQSRAPVNPAHPERVCWGCDKFCPAHELACGNGTIRAPHPAELFGEDWLEWVNEGGSRHSGPARGDHDRDG